jgi:hypothetical protein
MIKKHQRNITSFIRKVYCACFGVKLGDQDKSWAPHKVCYVCVENLKKLSKGKKKAFRFGIPMTWKEQKSHMIDIFAVAMLRVTVATPSY